MTASVRLHRDESPWPPLVPGGDGLNRYPEPPSALRRRMAEIWGVDPAQLLPVPGAAFALAHVASLLQLKVVHSFDFGFDETILPSGVPKRRDRALVFDLSGVYGLAGAPCGGIVANAELIAKLEASLAPNALASPVVKLAEAVLLPSRAVATRARADAIKAEHARMCAALGLAGEPRRWITLRGADPRAFEKLGLEVRWPEPRVALATIGTPDENDLVLVAMGVAVAPRARARTATVTRDTRETKIVASVDLDRADAAHVATGIGYFDHMLEQIASHGGFALTLAVEGDLHIDPHHTIEDASLALGQALKQALGDRAGIGRYGFTAPMDEAEGRVVLDLSGRPYSVFTGEFKASHIGQYPTALTQHVFRSLADSMGAAIHVHVAGDDDHHKTEVAFKAFGRALRQAIRIEGGGVPSTKGVL